jgi:7-keto-8-aminopelargonate synthetase-like enzyme
MDGDLCPLQSIVAYCERYNAHLIVDEAHATGIIGERGAGLVKELSVAPKNILPHPYIWVKLLVAMVR